MKPITKIGFTGAGGTGKSTTAKVLAEVLGLPYVVSSARPVFEKHGLFKEDDQDRLNPLKRWELQRDIFEHKRKVTEDNPRGVFDRTLLDSLFYSLFQCTAVLGRPLVSELVNKTARDLASYELIVLFPLYNWPDQQNDLRTTRYADRTLMDGFVRGTLVKSGFSFFEVKDESPEARVDSILEAVRAAGQRR